MRNVEIIRMLGKVLDIIFLRALMVLLISIGGLECCSKKDKEHNDPTTKEKPSTPSPSGKKIVYVNNTKFSIGRIFSCTNICYKQYTHTYAI